MLENHLQLQDPQRMNQSPEKEGAVVIPLARHSGMDHDSPAVRPSGDRKDARRPRRKAGAYEVRLRDSGRLVGIAHVDEPVRPVLIIGRRLDGRQRVVHLALALEPGPDPEVTDQAVSAWPPRGISGVEPDDRHRNTPPML